MDRFIDAAVEQFAHDHTEPETALYVRLREKTYRVMQWPWPGNADKVARARRASDSVCFVRPQTYSSRKRRRTRVTFQTGSDGKVRSLTIYPPKGQKGVPEAAGRCPDAKVWRLILFYETAGRRCSVNEAVS